MAGEQRRPQRLRRTHFFLAFFLAFFLSFFRLSSAAGACAIARTCAIAIASTCAIALSHRRKHTVETPSKGSAVTSVTQTPSHFGQRTTLAAAGTPRWMLQAVQVTCRHGEGGASVGRATGRQGVSKAGQVRAGVGRA